MPTNPFTRACAMAGCGAPVATRGRCASHAGQQDQHRSLGSDRQHLHLYTSARWRRLRLAVLAEHPLCTCDECRQTGRVLVASTVHHVRAHGGDPLRFFDVENLQAMSTDCHNRVTGRSRTGGLSQVDTSRAGHTAR